MKVLYDSKEIAFKRILSISVNGKEIEDNKVYSVAVDNYLALGGDGYKMFKNARKLSYDNPSRRILSDIVADYFIKTQDILPILDGRLKDKSMLNEK